MKREIKDDYIIKNLFTTSLMVMILSIVASTIGMLVDGIVVGKCLGTEAMASYGMVSPAFVIFSAVAGVFSSGAQTICAKYMGSGKLNRAIQVFSVTCVCLVLLSGLLTVVTIGFSGQFAQALGAKGDAAYLLEPVRDYLLGLSFGVPAIILVSVLSSFMRLDGDQSRTLYSVIAMTAVNVGGDLLNAYVFHRGMFGMAVATSVSYYVSLLVLVLHFFKKDAMYKLQLKNLQFSDISEVFFVGLPTAISRLCTTFRTMILNHFLLTIATSSAVAAFTVRSSLNSFLGSLSLGIGMTTLLISGLVRGEEDKKAIRHLMRVSMKYSLILNGLMAVVMLVFAPQLTAMFLKADDAETIALTIRSVRWYALSVPLCGINVVFMNYLQGIRNLKLAHLVCIFDNFVFVVLTALTLGRMIGVDGVWIAFVIGEILMLLLMFVLAALHERKLPLGLDDFLFLPKGFGVPDTHQCEVSIHDMNNVLLLSKRAAQFCREHGAEPRTEYLLALCIEEMAGNIVQYGFADGKPHSIDLRIIRKDKENEWIVRMRDDCKPFNPKKQMEIHNPEDPVANIGIRMIYKTAKDVTYVNSMRLNTLIIKY